MSDGKHEQTSTIIEPTSPVLGLKKVELLGHARMQMKVRDIDIGDILHTLNAPDKTDLPTQPGRSRYRWNKTLRSAVDVVFDLLPDRARIITGIAITRRLIERKK